MNAVISQTLCCLMSDVSDLGRWREFLPTVEMAVNLLPNKSIGYSPLFLMYRYHPMLTVYLLKEDKLTNIETLLKFMEKTQKVWRQGRVQMEKVVAMQKSYYDKKHWDIYFLVGDLVLLNTQNLRLKGIPHKL